MTAARPAEAMTSEELAHEERLRFPRYPASWYYFGQSKELAPDARQPLARTYLGRELIGFRDSSGRPVVMDARCCHMGANLGAGCLKDGTIECPLHGWRFDAGGRCAVIPHQERIPEWAEQRCYPTAERFGQVFFYSGDQPHFELPFFDGLDDGDLYPASPFQFEPECPWYIVGANAFDTQHFRMSHDRVVVGEPIISDLDGCARRIVTHMEIRPDCLRDRVLAACAGSSYRFTVTLWGGTIVLVTAEFPSGTSYGYVCIAPAGASKSVLRNTVFVRRRSGTPLAPLGNFLEAAVRRWFIKEFLRSDLPRVAGTYGSVSRCIEADYELKQYFYWASSLKSG